MNENHSYAAPGSSRYTQPPGSSRGKKLPFRKLLLPAAVVILLLLLYCFIASRYYRVFLPGTRINGTSIGGMTLEKAEQTLIDAAQEDYTLTVYFRGGSTETITGPQMDLSVTFGDEIADVLSAQNRFAWLPRLLGFGSRDELVSGIRLYSAGQLSDWLSSLSELQTDNMTPARDACMTFDETGHLTVRSEEEGSWVIASVALTVLENAVAEGVSEVTLDDVDGTYAVVTVTKDNAVLNEQIEALNRYLDTEVTYTMHDGSNVTVDALVIKDWLAQRSGAAGWYYLDEETLREGVESYVTQLAETYNYSYGSADFLSTNYGYLNMSVYDYSFGYVIDEEGETQALVDDILSCTQETRVPVYSVATPLTEGLGGTYIEVDTLVQKVYLYIDGELSYTADCVTGLASDPERVTPSGIYAIYDMETNTTLAGTVEETTGLPEYMSAVSYWMPFKGGYGLHDATWRTAFGGTVYQTNGSHGCVNLTYMAAQTIYNSITVGTPVVVIG